MFPILGGRLLKKFLKDALGCAIEFPILGGRLLKVVFLTSNKVREFVSNPWREAIEVPRYNQI